MTLFFIQNKILMKRTVKLSSNKFVACFTLLIFVYIFCHINTVSVPTNFIVIANPVIETIYEQSFNIVSSELCPKKGENLLLLILVHSTPANHEARSSIRATWRRFCDGTNVTVGFLLGRVTDELLIRSIREESDLHGDIIVSNNIDSYDNLTLKTVSMVEWASRYCQKVRFVLKIDEDVFINVPHLLEILRDLGEATWSIYGHILHEVKPYRSPSDRYYISVEEYPSVVYPTYVIGGLYLLTGDVTESLYQAALREQFFKMEDIFLTGFVAKTIKVSMIHLTGIFCNLYDVQRLTSWVWPWKFNPKGYDVDPCLVRKRCGVHGVDSEARLEIWKKLMHSDLQCVGDVFR